MDEINTTTPSASQPTVDTTPPVSPKKTPWMTIVTGVLVLGLLAAGAYYLKTKISPNDVNTNWNPSADHNQNPEPTVTPSPTPTESLQKAGVAPAVEGKISGEISWHYPTKIDLNLLKKDNPDYQYYSDLVFYDVGTFNSGQYKDQHIVIAPLPCEGPCRVVAKLVVNVDKADAKYIYLKNHSDPFDNIYSALVDVSKLTVDQTTKISDLNIPPSITGPGAKQNLTLAQAGFFVASYNLFTADKLKLVFNDPILGSVYMGPDDPSTVDPFFRSNGFYVKTADWNTAVYKMTPDFVGIDNIPKVSWTLGSPNTQEYQYVNIGGCGSTDYGNVMSSSKITYSDLDFSGSTSQGDKVYLLKDRNSQLLKDMYENDYHPFDPTTYQADPSLKVPYDQFVDDHPMFFWTDPFGRLIQFKNKKYIVTMAECAKPVIYLYPEKTENVSVKLSPVGGFKFTNPTYDNGWNVLASQDGNLTVNGTTYPYLFWEGWGGLYQTPDKGFVVKRSDVEAFLSDKLAQLGLNQKETTDFKEYWLPYMSQAPYYFITFMGNSAMNEIAPLTITPAPDTVIRILMDFKPLQAPIKVEGFNIKTPVRKGFTVVEWGGVKH